MVKLQERLDLTFAAISDQTRRTILRRLRKGPLSVSELAKPFGMSLAAVSKHLKVLERAELIRRKRDGRKFLIDLSVERLEEAEKWVESFREFWESSLDRLEAYVRAENEKAQSDGGGRQVSDAKRTSKGKAKK